ncbi:ATP-binding protein [Nocardiopsis changdeensis]|uniref:ATP-binding protein n=1 Tax=Nocardiopsis changdeensis TaxID=2831969 RepID=A0ABX8BGT9_9ACTN|nr:MULTISPECIES: ATP-binding protein [Nocardiopsis]QUX20564.1 ATP-binding protein [Nocardiopsis changdeensis]QYX36495.1 ATP-binding protein [Nocardiopsis sp. MT53]
MTRLVLSPPAAARTWWEHRTYPRVLPHVGRARHDLARDLAGFDTDTIDTALLCLGELAANAVEHTSGPCFHRALALIDERILWLAVLDDGGAVGSPHIPEQATEDLWRTSEDGRGLMLIQALAVEWGSYTLGPRENTTILGRAVWAALPIEPGAIPADLPAFVLTP